MNNKIKGIKGNFNHKKKSKIPFLLAALIILILALISGDSDDDYPSYNSVTYGGQTYKTVKIGTQTWLAENLNYKTEGSVCYENNPANCAKYGRLYNWETAMKVCPKGWHLPSNAEWDKLYHFVDGDTSTESLYNSITAGKYLKAKSGWNEESNGTDNYGFSALPGGRFSGSSFVGVGEVGSWWSASEQVYGSGAYSRGMNYTYNGAYWGIYDKFGLFSVRCIKD
ncbi:MAG: fibrobacter succinogenes major paralogous domain-containing protein [Candidatus Fibromonas sp.]|nr:fibrobacter succinogenes major paralogous domain-containing protein [Candidatus Fibromonas sp.]